ncbi:expressed unknown protein [Seminavis robusta]|uniref:Uncharacterized protein n=1 Tax=Seminavis robusta TaxID=568900 RepID=A0A9N8ELY0_9STRA|nr:expressed unknown protein [Seminavis robusta]|eukprot:Sro1440_g272860.1 n/a (347) ;mRNA; f:11448-12488
MATTHLEDFLTSSFSQWLFLLGRQARWACPILALLGTPCLLEPGNQCSSHQQCNSFWCRHGQCFDPLPNYATGPCYNHFECLGRHCVKPATQAAAGGGYSPPPQSAPTVLPPAAVGPTQSPVETSGETNHPEIELQPLQGQQQQPQPQQQQQQQQTCDLKPIGTFCHHDNECLSGNCNLFDCFFFLIFDCYKVCAPATGQGQPRDICTKGSQCQSAICADSNDVKEYECKVPASAEEEAEPGGQCIDQPKALGVACHQGSECQSGNCQHFDCAFLLFFNCYNMCVPANGQGQPGDFCIKDEQCASGVCGDSNRVGDKECKGTATGLGPTSVPGGGPNPVPVVSGPN